MIMPCIVLGQPQLLGLSQAYTIIGLSRLVSIGGTVSYLFLVGACNAFCSSDLVFMDYKMQSAVLLEASMLLGLMHIL